MSGISEEQLNEYEDEYEAKLALWNLSEHGPSVYSDHLKETLSFIKEIRRLREGLAWYGDTENYTIVRVPMLAGGMRDTREITDDNGERARKAREGK